MDRRAGERLCLLPLRCCPAAPLTTIRSLDPAARLAFCAGREGIIGLSRPQAGAAAQGWVRLGWPPCSSQPNPSSGLPFPLRALPRPPRAWHPRLVHLVYLRPRVL